VGLGTKILTTQSQEPRARCPPAMPPQPGRRQARRRPERMRGLETSMSSVNEHTVRDGRLNLYVMSNAMIEAAAGRGPGAGQVLDRTPRTSRCHHLIKAPPPRETLAPGAQ